MLKNPNFLGLRPGSHWGAQSLSSLRELHCSPDLLAGGKGTRCPCPITPLPFLAFRLGLASTSQGLIHYRVVCCQYCKYDYYTTNTQQCIFLLAIVLYFNLKRSQLTIYIVTSSKAHIGVGAQSTFAGLKHFCPLCMKN